MVFETKGKQITLLDTPGHQVSAGMGLPSRAMKHLRNGAEGIFLCILPWLTRRVSLTRSVTHPPTLSSTHSLI